MPQTVSTALTGYLFEGALRTLEGMRDGMNSSVNDPSPVTPYRVVFESGKVRLRHYAAAGHGHRTPILLVYALIKRPFVLDIEKGRSVIQYLTTAGFDVYMIDWLPPDGADAWRGFDSYVNADLHAAVRAVRAFTRSDQISILGYCFGGLLSLLYTALHPEYVRNLVTATTPYDLGTRDLPIYNLVDQMTDHTIDLVTRVYGNCPAWMVQTLFTAMAPAHHAIGKYMGLYRNQERAGYADSFELFERWMNSDVPLAGRIFEEITRRIFKRNELARGKFEIGGNRVALERITCPFLNIVAELDDVVPPSSSLPLPVKVGSRDALNLTFPTGHVGAMVSGAAHKRLWPQVGGWLVEHSN